MINTEEENKAIERAWVKSDCLTGTDIKAYFVKDGVETYAPEIQAISYDATKSPSFIEITYIMFDCDPIEKVKDSQFLRLKSGSEHGPIAHCEFRINVQPWNRKRWGVSIEDIVTEGRIILTACESKPWTKV